MSGRLLTARPDTLDFRDLMYVPTLVEVPRERPLEFYQIHGPEILDQGQEGACTGFGLAAVANYLLKTRLDSPDPIPVSARMLYEMAKRHDEWPGEDYSGSSARGAMKGWHKTGVCGEDVWPYRSGGSGSQLTRRRLVDAQERPLGAYFRVNHKDIVAMHSAITEVGILYATSMVHSGWDKVSAGGLIKYSPQVKGGHAFAIVGYDRDGFWIQNSWGDDWGKDGFARISYFDWLENGTDVWVARLGAPVRLDSSVAYSAGTFPSSQMGQSLAITDLRPHIVSLGNDGEPSAGGDFANTASEIRNFIREDFPRITQDWKKKRILLYAHGGLVGEKGAVQRVAEYREAMLKEEVYPLAFVWHSDFWSTLKNILSEALRQRKSEGIFDSAKDFMLDRLDDTLEPIARFGGGKAQWDEMKENALAASQAGGGARMVVQALKALMAEDPSIEVHIAGHSAGSIFMGPVVRDLAKFTNIATCQLWAPACTVDLFKKYYLPLLSGAGRDIREFALYTLSDQAERDDHCGHIYHKSLLYLVSNAFEEEYRPFKWGWPGAPILGMAKFIDKDPEIKGLFSNKTATWIVAPNQNSKVLMASGSTSHGGFDDDKATVKGTLARIVGSSKASAPIHFAASAAGREDRRSELQKA
ncbi:C1 family peptidase [Haloferula chungangensis]|uniref:C1 family peptidase n=1 Tax=Haloferula chungangensis TaxID=1048331 RepID=A0ABW2L7C4_9BACT